MPFGQSRPRAAPHLLGVSPTASQLAQGQPAQRGGRRMLGGGAGRAWWLWEWLGH